MIKFVKKKDSESASPEAEAGQVTDEERYAQAMRARGNAMRSATLFANMMNHGFGVSARGNALRSASLMGLLVFLAPVIVGALYLLLIREPGQREALIERTASAYATQQAMAVGAVVTTLKSRVQAAASSRAARQAFSLAPLSPGATEAGDNVQDGAAPIADSSGTAQSSEIKTLEGALQEFFPHALSLRLLRLNAMGTVELSGGRHGLRNHIEVDLVRQASSGEPARPEAYRHEERWIVSLAQMATNPQNPEDQAIVLVTLPAERFAPILTLPGESPAGRFTLRQLVHNQQVNREIDVLSRGDGDSDFAALADIPNTNWRVAFSPSPALVAELSARVRPDYDVLGVLFIGALVGFALALWRSGTALSREVERVIRGSQHTAALELDAPQLVMLAREMRRLAYRDDSSASTDSSAPAAAAAPAKNPARAPAATAASELPAAIFRAYDIRGIADEQLDDKTVFRIASAIGTMAGDMDEQTLVLACDGRNSSPRIKAVVEKALTQSGRDVVDIGLVPTPVLYYATRQDSMNSGVMVTGSHNPASHNGLKIVLKGRNLAEGGIDKLRDIAQGGRFSKGRGRVTQRDIVGDYIDHIAGDIAIAVSLKIVVDAGHGAAARVAPALLEELGCDVIPMNCDIDGNFPNRSPDSADEANIEGLVAQVLASEADLGVAYDGDGDRLTVVTGRGHILRTDTLMMVFARDVVSRNPGADVVYDVKCSRNLAQLVTGLGGRPVLCKTGHALIKAKMLETGALLGGEFSGHIFFGERWFGFDDGLYATGRLAEILSSQDLSLDDAIADLPQAVSTAEILVPVADEEKFALMERFIARANFPNGKLNKLDGLRVDFADGWGLLRASNTGPALTARFEASNEQQLDRIRGLFREQLASAAPQLSITF